MCLINSDLYKQHLPFIGIINMKTVQLSIELCVNPPGGSEPPGG